MKMIKKAQLNCSAEIITTGQYKPNETIHRGRPNEQGTINQNIIYTSAIGFKIVTYM